MKQRLLNIAVLALSVVIIAGASDEKKFGKELTLKTLTKVSDILASPDEYNGKRVLVKGPITGVCEMRGCWINIGSDKEFGQIQFKVDDGVIVFPMDTQGKTVTAEGIVDVRTVSAEDQIKQGKHHAEETGEEFDPATVTGPKVIVRLLGEGAVID